MDMTRTIDAGLVPRQEGFNPLTSRAGLRVISRTMPILGLTTRIERRLKDLGLTPRAASLKVSTNPDLFRNVMRFGEEANPKQETLAKIAEALEVSQQWLLTDIEVDPRAQGGSEVTPLDAKAPVPTALPKDVPVLGTAAGSELGKGAFQLSTDVVDYLRRPVGLAGAKDVYALYVEGDSMYPKYEPGDPIFVNPHRKPQPRDYVVVQEPDSNNGEMRAFVKRLIQITSKVVRTEQFNPPANIDFVVRPGLVVHRVTPESELYGF